MDVYYRTRVLKGRPLKRRYVVEDRGYRTPCWIWQLAINPNGYGQSQVGPRPVSAHKMMYEERHGPVPEGWQLDHLCRQHECVNPDHMEVVTCAENARRGDNAKLTYEDVAEIRALRVQGLLQREVAGLFGICRQTVSDIERGLTWVAPGGVYVAA